MKGRTISCMIEIITLKEEMSREIVDDIVVGPSTGFCVDLGGGDDCLGRDTGDAGMDIRRGGSR